ncbi:MAG: ABC transporter permease/substrate-binding protein [Corynebacterium sp.]|uniref:ABC transporter permease/substrate-binding protein n=1 Tax=Corynebacterium sp. TaxID=1720 RepID=UPI0026DC6479|nr:ABC transporter permease/substrate-binding protein [Corynebacterium sp.]MDO4761217.1 ABC transporter permease/substrate-binding protein [Corynebacterium sp.]
MDFYLGLVVEHLFISLGAAVVATIIGVGIGIWLSTRPSIAAPVIAAVNVAYTIPSIALLGVLITFTGIGNTTAVIALIIYGLLPVVRATFVGLRGVDPALIEASSGMGATPKQVFQTVTFPLALPQIVSSIRTMVTMTIALAGIASFVGAGGLGVAIYRGITTGNERMIIIGSALVAGLALIMDALLAIVQRGLTGTSANARKTLKIVTLLAIFSSLAGLLFTFVPHTDRTVRIASKPTTENLILAELAAQIIEEKTDVAVAKTLGVGGGTANIQKGMQAGDFDIYPEYTGTSWQVILKETANYDEGKFTLLNSKLHAQVQQSFGPMFGFNNTYSLAVTKQTAQRYNVKTLTDLAVVSSKLSFGAEYDFFEREDGFNALTDFYSLRFASEVDMDNGLKYQALLDGKIDVITVFTTDGQLSDPNIQLLEDDREFYPSYQAGIQGRDQFWEEFLEVKQALTVLHNTIDEATMAQMNHRVEIEGVSVADVARQFLQERNLITS